jgi:hypothetical protein
MLYYTIMFEMKPKMLWKHVEIFFFVVMCIQFCNTICCFYENNGALTLNERHACDIILGNTPFINRIHVLVSLIQELIDDIPNAM